MVKGKIFGLLVLLLASCIPYRKLDDGIKKIPRNKDFFTKKIRSKYDVHPPSGVDLNAFYYMDYCILPNGTKEQLYGEIVVSGYIFYMNGAVNRFGVDKDIESLDSLNLDPNYTGYRGVIYEEDGKEKLAMFVQITGYGEYGLMKHLGYPKAQGDSLVGSYGGKIAVYKKHILKPHQIFQADW